MEVVSYSMGLIDNQEKKSKEISEIMNESIINIVQIQNSAFNKLKKYPNKFKDLYSESEKAQEVIIKESELCKKLRCTVEELEMAKLQLFPDEVTLLDKMDSKDYARTMTPYEINEFNERVFLKLRKIIKTNRKNSSDGLYMKQLAELENLLGEEKFHKLLQISGTNIFNEFRKYFSLKGVVVVMLLFGYLDGSYYSSNSIAFLLNMSNEDVDRIYQKANILFKTNKTLSDDRKDRMVKELKI